MAKLYANSGDPDQMPHSAASDLGLHCLPITLLQVSQLQWDNKPYLGIVSDTQKMSCTRQNGITVYMQTLSSDSEQNEIHRV